MSAQTSGAAPLVLVVEDNLEMNAFLSDVLSTRYRVIAAFNGEEGLRLAREHRPDLIVSDIVMPRMTGVEMVRELRRHGETENLPVLILTAREDEEVKMQALGDGIQDHLYKPFSNQELLTRTSRLIVEHRRMEQKHRETYGLLRAVSDGITEAVYVKDAEGRYLFINPAGAQRFGLPVHEVLGKTVAELVGPEAAVRIHEEDRRVMQQGESKTYEETVTSRLDGVTRTYLSTKGPYRSIEKQVIGVIGLSRDITDRKQVEARLEEANERKDRFMAVLAHELRNPLAPLRNALYLLKKRADDPATVEKVRAMMERQVEHLANLVDDLLDVTRINRGKIILKLETLDLVKIVHQQTEDHRADFEKANLALQMNLPSTPVWVRGDATRLAQTLDNLLDNALKFSEPGGAVQINIAAEHDQAVVQVHDSGVGIEEAQMQRLFEPFSQADRSLDRARGGLGLGLALVKGLVELHGGSVQAGSAGKGKGAQFVLRFPLVAEPRLAAFENLPPARIRRHLRVLIVEDNRDTAESLRLLLETSGHQVTVAHSGAEGVEVGRSIRPQVVLCDIGLPAMDGFEVAKALRACAETREAILIATTGYGRAEDRERAKAAGFHAHLVKPVDPEKLLHQLDGYFP